MVTTVMYVNHITRLTNVGPSTVPGTGIVNNTHNTIMYFCMGLINAVAGRMGLVKILCHGPMQNTMHITGNSRPLPVSRVLSEEQRKAGCSSILSVLVGVLVCAFLGQLDQCGGQVCHNGLQRPTLGTVERRPVSRTRRTCTTMQDTPRVVIVRALDGTFAMSIM